MLDPAIDLAGPAVHTLVSWLGTYFVHSTVLVGGVWTFCRFLPLDALTRSLLWKMSLVGGLFTATLQTGLGVEPLFGSVNVASGAMTPMMPPMMPPPPAVPAVPVMHEPHVVVFRDAGVTAVYTAPRRAPTFTPMAPPSPRGAAAPTGSPVGATAWALAGLFVAGAAASLGRLGVTVIRLRRGLRGRQALRGGPLRERLGRLLARVRVPEDSVQLTMSERIGSPIALAGREIVVPERAHALVPRQQEAMLAHELAHVLRRDPAWQVLAAVIEAALFFQPLNRVARRGMQEAAEELCDDWAVRHTGSGLHLARCLAEVAGWPVHKDMSDRFVSPMAGRSSLLVRRVERLLDADARERGRWARRWRGVLGAGLLAIVGLAAPGLSLAEARAAVPSPPEPPTPPAPPLKPEPVFALTAAPMAPPVPMLAVAPVAPEAEAQPNRRQRRQLRRAERLGRKAEALRGKAGADTEAPIEIIVGGHAHGSKVVVVPRDLERLVRDATGFAGTEIRDLERAAAAIAKQAAKFDADHIKALERRAEAIVRRLPQLSVAQIEALGRQAEAKAEELEARVESLDLAGLADALESFDLDALAGDIEREVERAVQGHGAASDAKTERALRRAEHGRARAEAERVRRSSKAGARAGEAVQREVERALRDNVIDAEEGRRIGEAARRAAAAAK